MTSCLYPDCDRFKFLGVAQRFGFHHRRCVYVAVLSYARGQSVSHPIEKRDMFRVEQTR